MLDSFTEYQQRLGVIDLLSPSPTCRFSKKRIANDENLCAERDCPRLRGSGMVVNSLLSQQIAVFLTGDFLTPMFDAARPPFRKRKNI